MHAPLHVPHPFETIRLRRFGCPQADKVQIKDFMGTPLFLGTTMDKLSEANKDPTQLPNPSIAQVRQAVTEYCVLPLGSQVVKDYAPLNMTGKNKAGEPAPKNGTPVLLTGAEGTGKRMLVNAVAYECGANLFDLTPSNTEGSYPGKKAYEMVHTTLKVAKAMPPSVVLIGDAEAVWTSGKKKGGGAHCCRLITLCTEHQLAPAASFRKACMLLSTRALCCRRAAESHHQASHSVPEPEEGTSSHRDNRPRDHHRHLKQGGCSLSLDCASVPSTHVRTVWVD